MTSGWLPVLAAGVGALTGLAAARARIDAACNVPLVRADIPAQRLPLHSQALAHRRP